MGNRVAGIAYVKIDGEQFDVKGGLELPISDMERATIMGLSGPAGYSEKATEPYTKVTAIFGASFPIDKVRTGTDMTVTSELPNGKVYTLSGAFLRGTTSVKGDDGEIELDFGGMKGIWQ